MVPPPPPPPPLPENGNYPPPTKEQPGYLVYLNIINTLTQLLLGSIACVAFIVANQLSNTTSFKQHIYLCVTGYVILMSQAILTISPFSWSSSLKYKDKKTIHWIMQILGSVLAISGSVVRISNIDNHFQTAHGTLGILALIFTCLSLAGGIINLFAMKLKIYSTFIKIGHSCFGSLTMILALLSLMFAFDKDLYRLIHSDLNAKMMMSFTILALIGTLTPACINIVRRFSNTGTFGRT